MKKVVDREVEFSNRFELINIDNGMSVGTFDLKEIVGIIKQQGTEINAELFDSIDADLISLVSTMELDGNNLTLKNKDDEILQTLDLSTIAPDIDLDNYYKKAETDAIVLSETTRAETAEGNLAAEIDTLRTGLTKAETDITALGETTIQLDTDIQAEVAIREADNIKITKSIIEETTRAKEQEELLGGAIAKEISDRETAVKNLEDNKLNKVTNIKSSSVYGVKSTGEQAIFTMAQTVTTPNTIPVRTGNGTLKSRDAIESNDLITKKQLDDVDTNLTAQIEDLQVKTNNLTLKNSEQDDRITEAKTIADEATSIARGRSQSRVFDTVVDMELWLSDPANTELLNVGDNLYIKDTGVPDYWWNGTSASKLETEKPDLTQYYTKNQTDSLVKTEKDRAETAENVLNVAISQETNRATTKEEDISQDLSTLQTQVNKVEDRVEEVSYIASSAYHMPTIGIPVEDLDPKVRASLSKADNALQSFTETDPTVPAWAKSSSKPSYTKSEIGLGNVDNVKQYSNSNPPPYPVTSVNGQTGDVAVNVITASQIFDLVYPIGSIYMSVNDVNPQNLFGGTWVRLENRFLLGAGNAYTNGSTGGIAAVTLSQAQLPSHRHLVDSHDHLMRHSHTFSGSTSTGTLTSVEFDPQQTISGSGVFTVSSEINYWNKTGTSSKAISSRNVTFSMTPSGNLSGPDKTYTSSSEPYTNYIGNNEAHTNMPPYLVVNMWKRTA